MTNKVSDLEYALMYLKYGWTLLPMQFIKGEDGKMKKQPMVKWKEYQDRQPTVEEVTQWIANGWFLGIITGKTSGIVIVDDDRIKHQLPPMILDSTIIAKTKSGGTHYYFKYDRLVTNHANAEVFVDIRGEGGYCVLPPFNGYQWIKPPRLENRQQLPPLDPELEKQIVGEKMSASSKIELSDFENIWEGGRNQTMYQLACSVWNNDKLNENNKILQIEWLNETRCRDKDGNAHPLSPNELQTLISSAKSFVENHPKDRDNPPEVISSAVPRKLHEVVKTRMSEKELEKDCPKTGFYQLDKMIKGFIPSHLYTLTGDTNVGKTSLACNFAVNVAKQGKKVLYLALEPDCTVVDYIASVYHRLPFADLDVTKYDFSGMNIDIMTHADITSTQQLAKTLQELPRYDLVIVDHIGYFITDKANTTQEQSNVIKIMADITKRNHCSVMLIAHLNKPQRGAKTFIPSMNDISGSASFKQDSTDVWMVHKDKDINDPMGVKYLNTGGLVVGKSKAGFTGSINIQFAEKSAFVFEKMDVAVEMVKAEAIDDI